MPDTGNYALEADIAHLTKRPVADIAQEWKDFVDEEIEDFLGGGYKGATITVQEYGDGNHYIHLPSNADPAQPIAVTEDGNPLDVSTYGLWAGTRLLRRIGSGYLYQPTPFLMQGRPAWYEESEYVITYSEPTAVPKMVRGVAAQAVAIILMYSVKYQMVGIANSATSSSNQAGGSVNTTYAYPASLVAEVKNCIAVGLRKRGL